jgi:phosphoglycolate phosphatase
VTNKPAWLTDPLMAELGLTQRARAIVSGDTCAHAKPHPEPIEHACRLLGVPPARCLYVGDARRDIEAGRAAGSPTVAALFGYLLPDEDPAEWQADFHIGHAAELLDLLGLRDTDAGHG